MGSCRTFVGAVRTCKRSMTSWSRFDFRVVLHPALITVLFAASCCQEQGEKEVSNRAVLEDMIQVISLTPCFADVDCLMFARGTVE